MTPLRLFQGFGVELEYMIVDRESLAVMPLTDRVLEAQAGEVTDEVEVGPLCWSNELVLHVIELKTNGPVPSLDPLASTFAEHVRRINGLLEPRGAMLMPSGMHPWMDPLRETRLWPHDHSPVYEAFDRIFGCKGHGWSNLQSSHLNLPFHGDGEFGRLHAAIRLVLPILPALSAASPIVEGRVTGLLDSRLDVYRSNCARIPSITAAVVPEPVFTRGDYEREILQWMYRDVAPLDPEGVLQDEWLNARGAIARFDRSTIEIRVIDVQECPAADLAILDAVVKVLHSLVEERWCSLESQMDWPTEPLADLFLRSVKDADQAPIADPAYLGMFGVRSPCTAGELWRRIVPDPQPALTHILDRGPLARRILRRGDPRAAYRELCQCLQENRPLP